MRSEGGRNSATHVRPEEAAPPFGPIYPSINWRVPSAIAINSRALGNSDRSGQFVPSDMRNTTSSEPTLRVGRNGVGKKRDSASDSRIARRKAR